MTIKKFAEKWERDEDNKGASMKKEDFDVERDCGAYISTTIETKVCYDEETGEECEGEEYIHIHKVFVPKEFRGQGIAKDMLKELVAKERDLELRLVVKPEDSDITYDGLVRLYSDCGFIGEDDESYSGLIIMGA